MKKTTTLMIIAGAVGAVLLLTGRRASAGDFETTAPVRHPYVPEFTEQPPEWIKNKWAPFGGKPFGAFQDFVNKL